MPTSGKIRWREYRAISSLLSDGIACTGTSVSVAMFNLLIAQNDASAGDRRDNRQAVTVLDRRVLLVAQVTNVFVVQVNVHEGAQFAFLGIQVLFQFRMSEGEFIQRLTYGGSLNRHRGLLGGELTEGGRDVNLHSANSLLLIWLRSTRIAGPAVNS